MDYAFSVESAPVYRPPPPPAVAVTAAPDFFLHLYWSQESLVVDLSVRRLNEIYMGFPAVRSQLHWEPSRIMSPKAAAKLAVELMRAVYSNELWRNIRAGLDNTVEVYSGASRRWEEMPDDEAARHCLHSIAHSIRISRDSAQVPPDVPIPVPASMKKTMVEFGMIYEFYITRFDELWAEFKPRYITLLNGLEE